MLAFAYQERGVGKIVHSIEPVTTSQSGEVAIIVGDRVSNFGICIWYWGT